MSKQKTVFTTAELPHIWAHQSAPEGRAPGNSNISFSGPKFYSYGTCIALLVTGKNGKQGVIIDGAGFFSVSTSRHQTAVRRAISGEIEKFGVEIGGRGRSCSQFAYNDQTSVGEALRNYWLDKFHTGDEQAQKSKKAHIRAYEVLARAHAINEAVRVAEFFGLKRVGFLKRKQTAFKKYEEPAQQVIEAYEDARQTKRDQIQRKRDVVDLEKVAAWENGDQSVRPKNNWPVKLRVEESCVGDVVVTTLGARFPVADAERAYRFALIQRRRGWRKNGERQPVGSYELDAVNEQGVVAGCHRVAWEAIESLARRAGWLIEESADSNHPIGSGEHDVVLDAIHEHITGERLGED